MEKGYTTRDTCRVCGSCRLTQLFSLGKQYVSNFVDRENTHTGAKVPIDLELCRRCGLVQLEHTAPQEILYARKYWYRSGVTQTMRDDLQEVAETAEKLVPLTYDDVILDIGSNDGTLLRHYTSKAYKVGFEPATNLVEEGAQGINCLVNDFWSADAYNCHEWPKAKVITACGMMYDLEDPNSFIADVAKVLHPDGIFIAQLMCLANMLDLGDVGNLAHEHLEFYSLASLEYLFGMNGLDIFDIETNAVNGRSYRIFARHKGGLHHGQSYERLKAARWEEEKMELDSVELYRKWFAGLEENKNLCVNFIKQEVAKGKSVWVYGASTKGNVILQWYGLDSTLIKGAADRSPEKWGKYTIGSGIPIVSEEEGRKANPDYFLILPYSFINEFIEREQAWLNKGGTFIVPVPEFKLVGRNLPHEVSSWSGKMEVVV